MRGVYAPLLTPFNADGSIAGDLYLAHARALLDQGCVGLVPFGTTGEALSVGIDERIAAIQGLVEGGIDASCMMPGTGLSNVADTARLSRACLDLGCAAVMTLPPFYYKGVDEDGLCRYFEQLVIATGDDARIVLYHIPPVAVVGIPPSLVSRLRNEFPQQIIGIKDSSGDWENTVQLFTIEGLTVYPGSELRLLEALDRGAPGCITATANLNAAAITEVIRAWESGDHALAAELQSAVRHYRQVLLDYPPIAAQKRMLASRTGDSRWRNVRPPLMPLADSDGYRLEERLPQA